MCTPTVFISYSHDSADHKDWVLKLANDLVKLGVDVTLDQWDLAPGQDTSMFMQKGISDADRVLMICTDRYVEKAEDGKDGVGFERSIVSVEIVQSIDTNKFIPVIIRNENRSPIPIFIGTRLYIDFRDENSYSTKLNDLVREIHGAPAVFKPTLGPNPFSSTAPINAISKSGNDGLKEKILESSWFSDERSKAERDTEN